MSNEILELCISSEDIELKVDELATKIRSDYASKNLLVIGVLKGSVIFVSDLIRKIDLPLELSFIAISSYGKGTVSTGDVRLRFDIDLSCIDKDVLIVEDIVDTGYTLQFLKTHLKNKGSRSVKVCSLLDKPSKRVVDVDVDYIGFEVDDRFLVGYGLDYDNRYRNLPSIHAVKI